MSDDRRHRRSTGSTPRGSNYVYPIETCFRMALQQFTPKDQSKRNGSRRSSSYVQPGSTTKLLMKRIAEGRPVCAERPWRTFPDQAVLSITRSDSVMKASHLLFSDFQLLCQFHPRYPWG
jgi:hypothetical protein